MKTTYKVLNDHHICPPWSLYSSRSKVSNKHYKDDSSANEKIICTDFIKNTGILNHNIYIGASESRRTHPKLKVRPAFCEMSVVALTSGDHVPQSLSNYTTLITEPHQLWHNDKPANEEPCCFQSLSQHEQQCQTNKRIIGLLLFNRTREREARHQMERRPDTLSHTGRWEDVSDVSKTWSVRLLSELLI